MEKVDIIPIPIDISSAVEERVHEVEEPEQEFKEERLKEQQFTEQQFNEQRFTEQQFKEQQHLQGDHQYEVVTEEDGRDPQLTEPFILPHNIKNPHRFRSTWTEENIIGLLNIYINEHPMYLKAKAERQVVEFHENIGRLVDADGTIVAGLLKNLGREYRKAWGLCSGINMKLRGSKEICKKFEQYYKLYSRIGLQEARKTPKQSPSRMQASHRTPASHRMPKASPGMSPRIKKIRKTPPAPFPGATVLQNMMTPPQQVKIPPISVMSDKYCQEYIEVMREQNQALLEIGKELRLMRMGYFTEHELAMDS